MQTGMTGMQTQQLTQQWQGVRDMPRALSSPLLLILCQGLVCHDRVDVYVLRLAAGVVGVLHLPLARGLAAAINSPWRQRLLQDAVDHCMS
jgi:hypothetical protein